MKRELTKRELAMLLVLVVLVIVLGYYKLILEPINDQITDYRAQTVAEQTELDTDLVRAAQMEKMKKVVEESKAEGVVKTIPTYDNSAQLLQELYRVLGSAAKYSLDFSAGTEQEDYIIRRPITLEFQTGTYAQARAIIDALSDSQNLNQISDVNITTDQGENKNMVQTHLVITYYEVAS